MRTSLAVLALAMTTLAGEGQGPVEAGPIRIEDFELGTWWYGKKITGKDLRGKVVLIETWGS